MPLILKNILRFIFLFLFQLLVLNNVNFGESVVPFLYILALIMLPNTLAPGWMLFIGFSYGFCMDLFCNLLGFHAFSCTLLVFARILFADSILTRGELFVVDTPSIYSVHLTQFIGYLLPLVFLFYLSFFTIEQFECVGFWRLLLAVAVSSAVTILLILIYQFVFLHRSNSNN